MVPVGQNQVASLVRRQTTLCLVEFFKWPHRGEVAYCNYVVCSCRVETVGSVDAAGSDPGGVAE